MEPLWVVVMLTTIQFIGTGVIYFYDNYLDYTPFGLSDDSVRYENGEIYWWEVKDINRIIWKRIEQCNKAVASKDMPFIKSFLCLMQSWKLKLKIDAINLVKDCFAFAVTHKEFCLLVVCIVVLISLARMSVKRWKREVETNDDNCSYKSPYTLGSKHETGTICSEKVNIGDILEDWSKLKNNKGANTKESERR